MAKGAAALCFLIYGVSFVSANPFVYAEKKMTELWRLVHSFELSGNRAWVDGLGHHRQAPGPFPDRVTL